MFTSNLYNYVFRDNTRRLRDDRISLLIAFGCSVLRLMAGEPERAAAIEGLVILGICMLCLTVYAGLDTTRENVKERLMPHSWKYAVLYRPVSRRLAWLSASAIALLAALPEVEAAILDRRLRRLTTNVPLNRESIEEATQTVDEATKYKVKIPRKTIAALQSALRETAKSDPTLSEEALKGASAAASAATVDIGLPKEMQGHPMYDTLPEAKGSAWIFSAIATNTGPDNYSTIGVSRQPDVAKMERLVEPLPASGYGPYGPAFLLVKGLTATLDGYYLKHVVFQNMRLTYRGGPLILEDVYFFQCYFEFLPSENSWKLMSAIIAGGWIRFSSLSTPS
jgi:hypothetical protein